MNTSVLSGLHFLYVEDDADDSEAFRQMLADAGVQLSRVTSCSTVHMALIALGYQDYDVVLCDYFLGRDSHGRFRTASDFLTQLNQKYPEVPVILTSHADDFLPGDEVSRMARSGQLSFLPKRQWSPGKFAEKVAEARAIVMARDAQHPPIQASIAPLRFQEARQTL